MNRAKVSIWKDDYDALQSVVKQRMIARAPALQKMDDAGKMSLPFILHEVIKFFVEQG